jgi:hypothetical protein
MFCCDSENSNSLTTSQQAALGKMIGGTGTNFEMVVKYDPKAFSVFECDYGAELQRISQYAYHWNLGR